VLENTTGSVSYKWFRHFGAQGLDGALLKQPTEWPMFTEEAEKASK
jgi:hypothetical protein